MPVWVIWIDQEFMTTRYKRLPLHRRNHRLVGAKTTLLDGRSNKPATDNRFDFVRLPESDLTSLEVERHSRAHSGPGRRTVNLPLGKDTYIAAVVEGAPEMPIRLGPSHSSENGNEPGGVELGNGVLEIRCL